jgi:hypothetical protein
MQWNSNYTSYFPANNNKQQVLKLSISGDLKCGILGSCRSHNHSFCVGDCHQRQT